MSFGNWRQHKMNFFISTNLFMIFLLSIIRATSGNPLPLSFDPVEIENVASSHQYHRLARRIFEIPTKCPEGTEWIVKRCREILRE